MVRVENAADYPQFIEIVARWHWTAWGHADPEGSLERWTACLRSRANRDRVPMTFIAIDDADSPVGSVALVAHDMPDRTDLRHLSPWVAGTLSSAASEAKGIGKMLMRHAVAEADRVGAGELFLYASTARSFYERLGWTLLREDFYDGEPVAIMVLRS